MTAKEQLLQIRELEDYIKTMQDEIDVVWARLTSTTAPIKEMNVKTSKSDTMPETIEKVIKMRSAINEKIDYYVDLKNEAREIIDQIRPLNYQCVLIKYYFQNKTFEKTAVEMNMSYQWICELHNRALQEFDKIKKMQIVDRN